MTTNGCLEEKVVFVNGGARGIGAAAVRRMAREGAVLSVQDDAAAHGGPMVRASALVIAAGADLVAAIGFVSASLESVFFRSNQFLSPAFSVRGMSGTSRLDAFARSPIATALPGKLDAM